MFNGPSSLFPQTDEAQHPHKLGRAQTRRLVIGIGHGFGKTEFQVAKIAGIGAAGRVGQSDEAHDAVEIIGVFDPLLDVAAVFGRIGSSRALGQKVVKFLVRRGVVFGLEFHQHGDVDAQLRQFGNIGIDEARMEKRDDVLIADLGTTGKFLCVRQFVSNLGISFSRCEAVNLFERQSAIGEQIIFIAGKGEFFGQNVAPAVGIAPAFKILAFAQALHGERQRDLEFVEVPPQIFEGLKKRKLRRKTLAAQKGVGRIHDKLRTGQQVG